MGEYQHVTHSFDPIFNTASEILILGSLPSVKSREEGFYYGHPRNRFWKVLASVTDDAVPETIPDKKAFLLRHHIAIWDVIASCDIIGSSDSSIRNVEPTDIGCILAACPVRRIYANGKTAARLYRKYTESKTGLPICELPSTSPANAAWSLERLVTEWTRLLQL